MLRLAPTMTLEETLTLQVFPHECPKKPSVHRRDCLGDTTPTFIMVHALCIAMAAWLQQEDLPTRLDLQIAALVDEFVRNVCLHAASHLYLICAFPKWLYGTISALCRFEVQFPLTCATLLASYTVDSIEDPLQRNQRDRARSRELKEGIVGWLDMVRPFTQFRR